MFIHLRRLLDLLLFVLLAWAAPALVASGLMRLSSFPLAGYQRIEWTTCENANQADCLANKGFAFARHDLGGGAAVDI